MLMKYADLLWDIIITMIIYIYIYIICIFKSRDNWVLSLYKQYHYPSFGYVTVLYSSLILNIHEYNQVYMYICHGQKLD